VTPIRRLADAGFSTALLEHVISRLDPLDDYSGFASLLVNLQRALASVSRNLPALLSAPLLQLLPVLAAINAHISRVGIEKIATSSDSGRDGVANTTYGKFKDRPLYAAFVEEVVDLENDVQERVYLCFGLLLLSRLGIYAKDIPGAKEILVANGLRKILSNQTWFPIRAVLPRADANFVQQLGQLCRTDDRFPGMTASQCEFVGALSALGKTWSSRSGSSSVNRIDRQALDDDELDGTGEASRVRFEFHPSEGEFDQDFEPSDQIEFAETQSVPINDALNLPEHRLSAQAAVAAQRFCRDNQFLPNRWRALTDKEASEFVAAAKARLVEGTDLQYRGSALVASLVLITTMPPKAIADIVVARKVDSEELDVYLSEHVIDIERRVWWHTMPALPGRFSPTPEQASQLMPLTDWIALPLPEEICLFLNDHGPFPRLLSDCLGVSEYEMEILFRDFCQSLRRGSNRTSPARVRAHGFDYLVRKTADDTFASALQGTLEYAPYSPLYYFAFSTDVGVQAHIDRMSAVGWHNLKAVCHFPSEVRFGSRLQPTAHAVQGMVTELRDRLEAARLEYAKDRQPQTIARLHNALAIYTLAMTVSAIGHRCAKEYSICRWTLDLDDAFLMVADKILNSANSVRSIPLPPLVVDQILGYLNHLGYLASRASRFNPSLAASLRTFGQANAGCDALPLFFVLSDDLSAASILSHDVLRSSTGEVWSLPWNAARHLLEHDTRDLHLTAEYSHYRSGHISTGQQPYSPISPLVPERLTHTSATVVNQLLAQQRWGIECGISGRLRAPDYAERKEATNIEHFYLPDPIEKAQALVKESNARVVNSAIFSIKSKLEKQGPLNDDAVERIREEIIRKSREHPFLVAERLNLFRRMLKGGQKSGNFKIRRLPGIAAQYEEKPAFQPDAAWRVRQARAWRQGFLDGVALHEAQSFDDQIDRIAFSLIAFSAFTDASTVMPALHACFAMSFSEAGYLWVELPRRSARGDDVHEWIRRPLDPVTTCQVLNARSRYGGVLPREWSSENLVQRGVCRIAMLAARYSSLPIEAPRTIDAVCKAFIPWWRFHLPGILAAWCEGRLESVSMARPDFLRVLVGIDPAESGKSRVNTTAEHTTLAQLVHRPLDFVKGQKLLRRIGQILKAAHSDSVSGGKEASHYAYKLGRAREELRRLQPRLEQAPLILQAIAAWLMHLMEEGGASGKRLQASSIATYYWSIAYPLLEFFLEEDLTALDADALEDLYTQALDSRSRNTRIKRARTLRQFHGFCFARYGVAEVDWFEIEPMIDAESGHIDANLVTPKEYLRALNALRAHLDAGDVFAFKLSILLILMYRAGLRLGEAFRMTLDDFIFDDGTFIIFVRGNRFGKPKTANGRRQIHLGWRLPAAERELIVRMCDNRRALCGEAPETALFGSSSNPHQLDLRRTLEQNMGELLRWATGRNAVRPHHLRHSMASYCVASQFDLAADSSFAQSVSEYFGNQENPGEGLRIALLGNPVPSRRVMHAICAETGHGSPRTLLAVYANALEISLAEHLWGSAPTTIGDPDPSPGKGKDFDSAASINKYARPTALSGLSDSRLRRMMHDGLAVTDPVILARHLLNKMPVAHGVALLDPESRPQFQPAWAVSSPPTLEQLHGILSAATNGFASQQIAERWLMTEQKVGRILDVASMLAKTCRYDGYLIRSIQSSWYANVPEVQQQAVPKRIPNMPSGKRAGDTLERFVVSIRNLDDPVIREGLFAWSRCFRSAIPGLACDDPLDLKAFWNFLRRIGYDEMRLVVAVPVISVSAREELKKRLGEIGVPENSVQYMSRSYLSSLNDKNTLVPAILIKRTKDSKVESASCPMVSVHQYCYLCLIAFGASQ